LGIEPTVAIWSVLAALDYYKRLYDAIPAEIRKAADAALEKIREAADAEWQASRRRVEESLISAVVSAAQKVAGTTARRRLVQWVAGGVLGSIVICGSMFWIGYSAGGSAGYSHGRTDAIEVNAAANWAVTPAGMNAFRLWQAGDLEHLSNCDRPGWQAKDEVCYPQPDRGRVYGWSLK
jgi:hypothetical protein